MSTQKHRHPPPLSNYSLFLARSTCMLMSCFYHLLQQDSIRSLIIWYTVSRLMTSPSEAARNSNMQHSIAQKYLMFSKAQQHSETWKVIHSQINFRLRLQGKVAFLQENLAFIKSLLLLCLFPTVIKVKVVIFQSKQRKKMSFCYGRRFKKLQSSVSVMYWLNNTLDIQENLRSFLLNYVYPQSQLIKLLMVLWTHGHKSDMALQTLFVLYSKGLLSFWVYYLSIAIQILFFSFFFSKSTD